MSSSQGPVPGISTIISSLCLNAPSGRELTTLPDEDTGFCGGWLLTGGTNFFLLCPRCPWGRGKQPSQVELSAVAMG